MGKYCTNCGKELHTGVRFCAKCGAAVLDAPANPVPAAQPKPVPQPQPQTKTEVQPQEYTPPVATPKRKSAAAPKRNSGRNALCIVLSALLIIAYGKHTYSKVYATGVNEITVTYKLYFTRENGGITMTGVGSQTINGNPAGSWSYNETKIN
ncbi:MAG: zinc ribbon domain-containing protein [Lachnospiraceae bacterium]|nr:zinc ribbon domain-containing protein [Lachnospiraceae bacterium]